jgi:gliding motility-associated lipoprotein GldH
MESVVKLPAKLSAVGFALLLMSCLPACDSTRLFDQDYDMSDAVWPVDSVQRFTFFVADTSASYNLYYKVRNSPDYGYYNLYLKFSLEDSLRQVVKSELQEVILFDPKTGKPFGSGLGSIFSHSFPAASGYKFPYSGNFTFSVHQYMRVESLEGIHSIGLRIEEAN